MPYSLIQLVETPMQIYTVNSDIYMYEHIATCMLSYWKTTYISNVCCTGVKRWFVPLLPAIICLDTDLSFTGYVAALQVNKVAHVYLRMLWQLLTLSPA